jgi:DNA-binding NarL/FixJ family response regulator
MIHTQSLSLCGPRLWREALAQRLSAEADLRVASCLASAEDRFDTIDEEEQASDWLILFGDFDGDEQREIVERCAPHQRVLIAGRSTVDASTPLDALFFGRLGWVEPEASLDVMLATLRQRAGGGGTCSPQLLATLAHQANVQRSTQPKHGECRPTLTPREHAIAALVAEGLLNKQIAKRLGIRLATVKSHVHNLLQKQQVQRRGQIQRYVDPGDATLSAQAILPAEPHRPYGGERQ